jgi:phosphatidylglycerol:prolipoprotein diacylglycerol transferase
MFLIARLHPEFNPVVIVIGSVNILWYGFMYLFGFFGFSMMGRIKRSSPEVRWPQRGLPPDASFFISPYVDC